jgi:hypothetical protein
MTPPDSFPVLRDYGSGPSEEGGAVIVSLIERRGAGTRPSARPKVHADVAHLRDYAVRKTPARRRRAVPHAAEPVVAAPLVDPDCIAALDTLLHQHIEMHLDLMAAGYKGQGEVADNIRRSVALLLKLRGR